MATKNGRTLFYELRGCLLLLTMIFTLSCSSVKGEIEVTATNQNSTSSELSQTDIENLLALRGDYFVEIARFKKELFDDYWRQEPEIQSIVNKLGDYHRFIVESGFKREANGYINYDEYNRILLGPFDKEEAAQEVQHLINAGYKEAALQQLLLESNEIDRPEKHQLLFLYTKNQGPKFISGWIHQWFGYIEYVVDKESNKLLFHSLHTYHGDRYCGRLFLVDGKDGTMQIFNDYAPQGFVLLANHTLLLERSFDFKPKDPAEMTDEATYPFCPLDKIEPASLAEVAKKIGVSPNKLSPQYVGDRPTISVSVLFELNLQTGQSKSLKIFTGLGGLLMMKDGTIFSSNNFTTAAYSGSGFNYALGTFGKKPYYRVDVQKRTTVKMPEEFMPKLNDIAQPLFAVPEKLQEIKTIVEVGAVKLISFNGIFYLQH